MLLFLLCFCSHSLREKNGLFILDSYDNLNLSHLDTKLPLGVHHSAEIGNRIYKASILELFGNHRGSVGSWKHLHIAPRVPCVRYMHQYFTSLDLAITWNSTTKMCESFIYTCTDSFPTPERFLCCSTTTPWLDMLSGPILKTWITYSVNI
jgi:hypothetical protein